MSEFVNFLVLLCVNVAFVIVEIVAAVLYSDAVLRLLEKDRHWFRSLLFSLLILFSLTLLYSWLPGRLGLEVTLLEGMFTLRDGAVLSNFGWMLVAQAVCIGLAVIKHLWAGIRKKGKISGKFLLIELAFIVLYGYVGVKLTEREETVTYSTDPSSAKTAYLILAVVGFGICVWIFRQIRKDWKQQKAAAKDVDADAYNQVLEERRRLQQQGDNAGLVQLLNKATELRVSPAKKAVIWNALGVAHEDLGASSRAEECYRTALKVDPNNPGAQNNLALLLTAGGQAGQAVTYMQNALREAKKRGLPLGLYYGNYAYAVGKNGDLKQAEALLKQAASAGLEEKSVQTIRRKLGLQVSQNKS